MKSTAFGFQRMGLAMVAIFSISVGVGGGQARNRVPMNATVDVSIVDFVPAIIAIQPGDTVRWTNTSTAIVHTTTSGGPFDPFPGSIWDSGLLSSGESFRFVFDTVGEFDYFCTIHPLFMFGQIIVGGSGVQVAMVPDDISSTALSDLDVDVSVFNFTPVEQSGDLWFTVVLPSGGEIDNPASFLSLPTNPMSGTVPANDRLDLHVTISVPPAAAAGHYGVRAKIGTYPSGVADMTSFEFDVP